MQKSYLIKMFVSYEGVLMFCSVEIFQNPRWKIFIVAFDQMILQTYVSYCKKPVTKNIPIINGRVCKLPLRIHV
jgi:hypothetical protein